MSFLRASPYAVTLFPSKLTEDVDHLTLNHFGQYYLGSHFLGCPEIRSVVVWRAMQTHNLT